MTLPPERPWPSIQPHSDTTGGRCGVSTLLSPCNPSPSSSLNSLPLSLQLDGKSLKIQSVLVLVNVSFSKERVLIPGQLESSFTGRVSMKKSIRISQPAPNSYFAALSPCSPLAFPKAPKHFKVYLESFWDCMAWYISSLIRIVRDYDEPHPEKQETSILINEMRN